LEDLRDPEIECFQEEWCSRAHVYTQ
jgi:hypothetical protein